MFKETEMVVVHDEVHKILNGILCGLSSLLAVYLRYKQSILDNKRKIHISAAYSTTKPVTVAERPKA
jgi:hypothetical protein